MIERLSKSSLKRLRQQHAEFLDRWKGNGKRTNTWNCPHCKAENETLRPERREVTKRRPYWDSLTVCLECGGSSMVTSYASGRTTVDSLNALTAA